MTMHRSTKTGFGAPRCALALTTALAAILLASCATPAAPRADLSFSQAEAALRKGQAEKAIVHAEAAVLAEPRNPSLRALLGSAYLKAGRFQSAATSFGDALALGDESPRTVLSYALAKIALGEAQEATDLLDAYAQRIDPADLGLAYALAGQAERGVHVLINAVRRVEQASPKLRQNLAYSYALAGNWRAARVMAAEDVPADQLDARLTEWARMAAPEQFQQRVAAILGVTPRPDSGQPRQLALANFPAPAVMVAEAAAQADTAAPGEAAPAPAPAEPAVQTAPRPSFAEAFAAPPAAPTPAESGEVRFVSNPVVQQLPARAAPRLAAAAPPAQRRIADTPTAAPPSQRRLAPTRAAAAAASEKSDKGANTHLVQLGAYDSKSEAERGWSVLKARFPQLKDHDVVITEAVVSGRTFWRLAAAGFGPMSAKAMCSTIKAAGRGCFAYAAANPPAGAVDRGVRLAASTR